VINMMQGNLGQPHGGFPEAIQKKILKDRPAITQRPGELLEPVDLDAARAECQEACGGVAIDDEDLNGYLMYPKEFVAYMKEHADFGPVRTLPTLNFFYGMEPGDQISAEIDPGKTLEIRLAAVSEPHEDGFSRVFFELNGQPRRIRVRDRSAAATHVEQVKADDGNPDHVGAPMPGQVATVSVAAGQTVKTGDLLVTLEAMKMETGLHADRDGTIKAVHVSSGSQVEAKDLLVEYEA